MKKHWLTRGRERSEQRHQRHKMRMRVWDDYEFNLSHGVRSRALTRRSVLCTHQEVYSVYRFRSNDAHYEQKRIKLRRDGHSKESKTPKVVLTASGRVHTHEEAQSVRS